MLKSVLIISSLLFSLIFIQCKDNITGINDVSLNMEFELGVNQTAHIKDTDLLLTFVKVIEDSRCPTVNGQPGDCISLGNGKIELIIDAHKQARVDSLNTFLDPKESNFYGYKIELKGLMPYPAIEFDEEIQKFIKVTSHHYVIKLKVTKSGLL